MLPPLRVGGRLRLAVEVLAAYAEVRWRLRRGALADTVAALRDRAAGQWRAPDLTTHWRGIRLAKATTRTLALLPADTRCLMRSLVLVGLLSRRRIPAVLVIAAKAEAGFEAHAWVEHASRPLLPSGDFERLVEL